MSALFISFCVSLSQTHIHAQRQWSERVSAVSPGSPHCTHIHHSVAVLTEPSAPQATGPHIHTSIHTPLHLHTITDKRGRMKRHQWYHEVLKLPTGFDLLINMLTVFCSFGTVQ